MPNTLNTQTGTGTEKAGEGTGLTLWRASSGSGRRSEATAGFPWFTVNLRGRWALGLTAYALAPCPTLRFTFRFVFRPSSMRFFRLVVAVCLLGSAGLIANAAPDMPAPRERLSFNAGWRFTLGDSPDAGGSLAYPKIKDALLASAETFASDAPPPAAPSEPGRGEAFTLPDFNDSAWRSLSLPHDWGIEGAFDPYLAGETGKLPWFGVAWYRKHFSVPAADAGRQIYLDVDGAMSYSAVWCNGRFVGGWPYGYSSFRLDLTPHLKPGADNVIAIRLDNPNESSRWYPGGGLYRNVWLVKTAPIHVAHWGAFVTTPEVSAAAATVRVAVKLDNRTATARHVQVQTQVFRLVSLDGATTREPVAMSTATRVTAAAGRFTDLDQTIVVEKPQLWSPAHPARYVAVVRVTDAAGVVLDTDETPFGIRTARFDAERGFLLNGERVQLQGVCEHHDLGALGAAFNLRAMERKLQLLQSMGVNALRTSHNPPAPEVLDLCDRMGILVLDEAFDGWQRAKKPNGYNLLFDAWSARDLHALIFRDRNHPSVIAWSIGNEIIEQGTPEGSRIGAGLTAIVHAADPTRPSTIGSNNTNAGFNGFQHAVDVFGYNYRGEHYPKFRQISPDRPVFGSETASALSTRGFYVFPVSGRKQDGKRDFQMSSYDLYAPHWGKIPDDEFRLHDTFPAAAGEFVWTGFDYLGEPTPYSSDATNLLNFSDPAERERMKQELEANGKKPMPSRSSYFGIIDLAGFPKDRFYLYQAHWRPDFPMAHLLPHWNWPGRVGQVTPVHLYTSGDEAELFLNGKSLGRKKKTEGDYRLRWDDVVYAPGELKAVAYKAGREWATDVVRTTSAAASLALSADHATPRADGVDLVYVTLRVTDANGFTVPTAKDQVRFEVSGPADLVATDNGDPTDQTRFASAERAAFNGLALAIIRPHAGAGGPITVRATGAGLSEATMTIKALAADESRSEGKR